MKEQILKLRNEGKTYNEIKEILGCSKGTISFHCGNGQKEKSNSRKKTNRVKLNGIKYNIMDDTSWIGGLAEVRVMAELTRQRFHVFNQVTGKAPFDLVAVKGGKLLKISVKGTFRKKSIKTSSYEIQIGRIRSNKSKNNVYKFNKYECDYLAVYINDIDKVCFIKSNKINSGRVITVRDSRSVYGKKTSFLISDNLELRE
jgi:hypothetical protein